MSVVITIQGTVIEFPSSGQSPNWAPAVIEFAQAVEQALSGVAGDYDVSPQAIDITNGASSTPITALSFPTSVVRSVIIRYSIYRICDDVTVSITTTLDSPIITVSSATNLEVGAKLSSANANGTIVSIVGTTVTLNSQATSTGIVPGIFSYNETEAGTMTLAYDSVNSSWSLQRDFTGNTDGKGVSFSVDSVGQMYYTSTSIAGSNYSGKLSFAAQALLQS